MPLKIPLDQAYGLRPRDPILAQSKKFETLEKCHQNTHGLYESSALIINGDTYSAVC